MIIEEYEETGMMRFVALAGWVALAALLLTTAVHAVTLTIERVGRIEGIMDVIRVASPIITEMVAAVVAVGFAVSLWRKDQRITGLIIEGIWVLFAALNLVTSFASESTGVGGWMGAWLDYGLPLSALITGVLFYAMLRQDPDHQREQKAIAIGELHTATKFKEREAVMKSSQMKSIHRQQAWLDVIEDLRKAGYNDHQIRFMLSAVPQLGALPTSDQSKEAETSDEDTRFPTTPALAPSANGTNYDITGFWEEGGADE